MMALAYKGRLPNKKVWRSGHQVTLQSGSLSLYLPQMDSGNHPEGPKVQCFLEPCLKVPCGQEYCVVQDVLE